MGKSVLNKHTCVTFFYPILFNQGANLNNRN